MLWCDFESFRRLIQLTAIAVASSLSTMKENLYEIIPLSYRATVEESNPAKSVGESNGDGSATSV
jgi:hypothetical protein